MFQVKKCAVENCCRPRVSETVFPWLPDPVVKEDDKDHYKPFDDVVNTATVDGRPSAQVPKSKDVAEQQQVFHRCNITIDFNNSSEQGKYSINMIYKDL